MNAGFVDRFGERHAPASYGPLLAATVVASGGELALSVWMYRLTSAFPSTAAAAVVTDARFFA